VDGETCAYPVSADSAVAQALWMEPVPSRVVVATDHAGIVLGAARMGPNRPGLGGHIGTASCNAPAARGQGVGQALAIDIIDGHRAQIFRGTQFNAIVVETNTSAVALWRALVFRSSAPCRRFSTRAAAVWWVLHVMYLALST